MFVVFEPLCMGAEHVEFNAALLATIRAAFPGERLLFLAEADHMRLVRDRVRAVEGAAGARAAPAVRFGAIRPPERAARNLRRYLGERAAMSRLVRFLARVGARGLVLSSATAEGVLALGRVLARARGAPPVQIFFHAILESLIRRPPRHPVNRFFSLRRALRARAAHPLRYVVLSPTFERRLGEELPWLRPRLLSMEHPYVFERAPAPRPLRSPVAFGTVGAARAAKGSQAWGPLAQSVRQAVGPAAASFFHVGVVCEPELLHMGPAVGLPMQAGRTRTDPAEGLAWIARADYERELERLDYVVFLYPPGSYTLTASGALLDALALGKPVIALRNPYFEHCFELLGDIGYLCGDLDELRELMIGLVRAPPVERHARQQAAIATGRKLLAPETVAATFAANWAKLAR